MALEGVEGPAVLTEARIVQTADVVQRSAVATCVDQELGPRLAGVAVERTGVTGESVTFVDAAHRYVYACDNSAGDREGNRRWCGGSAGQLYGGRLRDPRLDVLCSTRDGQRMGFVWVQPSAVTRYVAVGQPEYSEVYEPEGGLPVRIATTSGVGDLPLQATIDVSEHRATGKLLRRYRVTAVPAG